MDMSGLQDLTCIHNLTEEYRKQWGTNEDPQDPESTHSGRTQTGPWRIKKKCLKTIVNGDASCLTLTPQNVRNKQNRDRMTKAAWKEKGKKRKGATAWTVGIRP